MDDKHCNNRCHLEVKILDITPPANTILSPMNMTYYTMDVSLEYKVDEPTDWVGYILDGMANETLTGNTTLSGLSLGSHILTVYANDTSGNMGHSTVHFTVADETPPVVDIVSPMNTTYYTTEVSLEYKVEEEYPDWVGYSLDGAANETLTGNTTLTNLGLGSHDLTVYASDTSRYWGKDTVYFTVKDATPPVVDIISPINTTYTAASIPLEYKVEEEHPDWVGYSLDGAANVTLTGNTTLSGLSYALHSITVYANDTSGNWGEDTVYFTVAKDETPPAVTIISPAWEKTYYSSSVPLTYKVEEENPDWIGYSLDGATNVTLTGNTTLTNLGLDDHDLTVYANDTFGNWGSDTVGFAVEDVTPPVVDIISPTNTTYTTNSIPLEYNVDEEYSKWVGYSLDGSANETLTGNTTLSGLTLGPHDLTVYANDASGNWGWDTVSFTVADETSPVVTIVSPMNTTYYTTDVSLEYKVEEEHPDWVGYSLDGVANITLTGNTTLSGLSYAPHSVTVYANDTSGNEGWSTVWFTVAKDETPPVITIISPKNMTYKRESIPTSISLTYNVNEPTDWEGYSLDGKANVTLTGDTTLSGLYEGHYTLTVYANDTSGNMGHSSVSFTVEKKKEDGPKPPINPPPDPVTLHDPMDITNTSMSLTWTENEDYDFKKYVLYYSTSKDSKGQKVTEITDRSGTSHQMTGLSENTTYYYIVRVYDTVDQFSDSNQVSARTNATIIPLDEEPPILTILSPLNATYDTSSVELTWLANEPLSWAGFTLNGGANTTVTGNQTISGLEDGLYDLMLYGTDLAGNNGSDSVSFTIYTLVPDTTPPEITHTPVTEGVEGNPIEISAVITDESGVEEAVLYYRKGSDADYLSLVMATAGADTYTATIPASFVDAETIEYYIFASDGVNEATHPSLAPTSSPHVVDVNLYPDPVALYEPASAAISTDSVELTWSESNEADFRNYMVYLSGSEGVLGDDIEEITERTETSHTVEELEPGTTYYFTVRVYDVGGLYADSAQLEVGTAVRRVFWSMYMFTFLLILLPLAAGGAIYYMRKRGKGPAGIITSGDKLT